MTSVSPGEAITATDLTGITWSLVAKGEATIVVGPTATNKEGKVAHNTLSKALLGEVEGFEETIDVLLRAAHSVNLDRAGFVPPPDLRGTLLRDKVSMVMTYNDTCTPDQIGAWLRRAMELTL